MSERKFFFQTCKENVQPYQNLRKGVSRSKKALLENKMCSKILDTDDDDSNQVSNAINILALKV